MQVTELVELAEKASGGTPTSLAHRLNVKPPVVFEWKSGKRTCTAEDRALLADIAGVDPLPEIAEALIERCSGKPKEEQLRRVLLARLQSVGKSWLYPVMQRIRLAGHRRRQPP